MRECEQNILDRESISVKKYLLLSVKKALAHQDVHRCFVLFSYKRTYNIRHARESGIYKEIVLTSCSKE